jgi:hypothetical protein
MWTRVCAGFAVVAVAAALGCGGGGEDKDKEAAGKACGPAPAAMQGNPGLSPGFAQPAEVTYTARSKKGPTTEVDGYFAGDIDKAFDTYKGGFHDPFTVGHTEHEAVDAEIEFESGVTEGQVKLLQTCKDRTNVALTIRPK